MELYNLGSFLKDAINPLSQQARESGLQNLNAARQQNFPIFLLSLCAELANNEREVEIRAQAGVFLKNCLVPTNTRDEATQRELAKAWLSVDPAIRQQIKNGVFQTFSTELKQVRVVASQIIGAIAKIEIPADQWKDLVDILTQFPNNQFPSVRQAILDTIGFVVEDAPGLLRDKANQVLGIIMTAMSTQETNLDIRTAAARAFGHSLELYRGNFETENERNTIMQVVLESTQAQSAKMRTLTFEALARIAELYYQQLYPHMHHASSITLQAIKKDEEQVAQQALEFWSTIAEEEITIAEQQKQADEDGTPNEAPRSYGYVKGVLPYLVPVLTETLLKQEEIDEEDEWNVVMAAGTCLALVATTVGSEIIPHISPFIKNLQEKGNDKWRIRDAAVFAFGTILEGTTLDTGGNYDGQAAENPQVSQLITVFVLPYLLEFLQDGAQHAKVKDTTAWAMGRICKYYPNTITQHLQTLQTLFVALLQPNVPAKISANVCYAIYELGTALGADSSAKNGILSPYFNNYMQALLFVTERPDARQNKLRTLAYDAINSLIQYSAQDTIPALQSLVGIFTERLKQTFAAGGDANEKYQLQSHLIVTLQTITFKLGADMAPFADPVMELYLAIFRIPSSSVQEDALMGIQTLVSAIETEFDKYMIAFRPVLLECLSRWQEYHICGVAVGTLGDICRAIGEKILPYCNEILSILLNNLKNASLHRDVLPQIMGVFGDVAVALGGNFDRYFAPIIQMLTSATKFEVDPNTADYALLIYFNNLHEGLFEAFSGIIHGLKTDGKAGLMEPYVDTILAFIQKVWTGQPTDAVRKLAVAMIGDLAVGLGNRISFKLKAEPIKNIINQALDDQEEIPVKEVAQWTKQSIESLGK